MGRAHASLVTITRSAEALGSTAGAGRFPAGHAARAEVVNAIFLANDFTDIAKFLPPSDVPALRESLAFAIGGTLAQNERQRRPYQAQSELWVYTVLSRGQLAPKAPARGARKTPDFELENGVSLYGVEVKRPEKNATALRLLGEARDQLIEHGTKGAIVLDLTDCFREDPPAEIEQRHEALWMSLHREIWRNAREGYQPGYSSVMVLAATARALRLVGDPRPIVDLCNVSGVAWFEGVPGTVHARHGKWIHDGISTGLAIAGFSADTTGWDRELRLISRRRSESPRG